MNIGYYPGCSAEGTGKEADLSLKEVFKVLDIGLDELEDWSCCGATSAHVTSHLLAVALPARNLLLAQKQGLNELLAPCAACYSRLVSSQKELRLDEKTRMRVEDLLEDKMNTGMKICNLLQVFEEIGPTKLKEHTVAELKNLKVACYYGCLLVRPADIALADDVEDPHSMERIVEAMGAKTINWNFKTECCGAAHSIAHTDIVIKLSKMILDDAIKRGADVIVVACPMCHSNLDMRQLAIIDQDKGRSQIPVLYLTELIGLAMGIEPAALGINSHYIDVKPLLSKITKREVVCA
ncbi:MAG: CoB--CoM heterodisulfide reductase iron-sulfur subunit B family protein [Ignavibacteriales bacterium]|nr:CoB--CoM heterodisulfide reductase iron-sulfur subunit B family protein [Ignavibacteriales bacterium]